MLQRCTAVMDPEGNAVPLVPEMKKLLEETVTNMASTGLRTLCLTYRCTPGGPPSVAEIPLCHGDARGSPLVMEVAYHAACTYLACHSRGRQTVVPALMAGQCSSWEGCQNPTYCCRDLDASLADQPDAFEHPPDEELTLCCIIGIKVPPLAQSCGSSYAADLLACGMLATACCCCSTVPNTLPVRFASMMQSPKRRPYAPIYVWVLI